MPSAWQGWVVLAPFVVLVAAGAVLFPPGCHLWRCPVYVAAFAAALVGLGWWKGEPPAWR